MSCAFCSFCTHANPSAARFCNQCGSPLGLKPCPSCEAVNDAAAAHCHQCGAAFEVPPPAEEAGTALDALPSGEATSDTLDASYHGEGTSDALDAPHPGEARSDALDPSQAGEAAGTVFAGGAHIPESLADRLERGFGARPGERVEPRVEAPPTPALAEGDVGRSSSPISDRRRIQARGTAPLAFALLLVLGGASYYLYTSHASDVRRLGEIALAGLYGDNSPGSRKPSQAAPAAENHPTEPPAESGARERQPAASRSEDTPAVESDTTQPSGSNPAAAALVSVQPGAPGTPAIDAASGQNDGTEKAQATARPAGAASRNDEDAVRKSDPPSRSRRSPNADALATQRLIARDLGTFSSPLPRVRDTPLDRDAIETQRLIERDLGPFLYRNDGGAMQGTNPAINY